MLLWASSFRRADTLHGGGLLPDVVMSGFVAPSGNLRASVSSLSNR